MLQKITPTTGSVVPFSDPLIHQAVASNAMTVVHLLQMTGILVTRCAALHHSPVFLVEVAHGKRVLTRDNINSIADVLRVPNKLLQTAAQDSKERHEFIGQFLIANSRLSNDRVPVRNEDKLLMKRFPEVVEALNAEAAQAKEERDGTDWYE